MVRDSLNKYYETQKETTNFFDFVKCEANSKNRRKQTMQRK